MTTAQVLERLDHVRQVRSGWKARCPAHADRDPSLTVREGKKAILLRCWAGCSIHNIVAALGLRLSDLFFFSQTDRTYRASHQQCRLQKERERRRQKAKAEIAGLLMDVQREADYLVRSARFNISELTDAELDRVLNILADAYGVLERDTNHG